MALTQNMTEGSPTKHLLRFACPLYFGLLFQQMYNLADTAIVGKLLGSSALAAVGAPGAVVFMLVGFCMGLTQGFGIPVAQCFGAGDQKNMRRYVGNAIWISAFAALALAIATVLLSRQIMVWQQTPEDILDDSVTYVRIIFLAVPATILYNFVSGMLRSLGNSRTPLILLIISSVLNIILDLAFIILFHMGVAGAAWATLIAQAVSGILGVIYIARRCEPLHVKKDELALSGKIIGKLCYIGVPMGLQYSITAIGLLILQVFLNRLGSTAVAATTAGIKVSNFLTTAIDALGGSMATYCGQNVGAQRFDRLKKGIISAGIIGSIFSAVIFLLLIPLGRYCIMLFVSSSDTEVITLAARFLLIYAAAYIPLTFVNVLRFSIQGMGFSIQAILAGVMEMIGRSLAGIFLVPAIGFVGACLASPLAWLLADAYLIPCTVWCIRRLRKNAARPAE